MRTLAALPTKQPIDVLLVAPGGLNQVYQGLSHEFTAIEPPSIAALYATYLRERGFSIDIIDAAAFNLSPEQVAEHIVDNFVPVLVVMVVYGSQPSASTQCMPAAGATCRALRKRDQKTKIMMLGTHPAALPERTLKEEAVDFVCSGEGPVTIAETTFALKENQKLFNIPDLWFYREGKVVSNDQGQLLIDLDQEMPGGAWDLLPMERYRCHNWHAFANLEHRAPYVSIHTSLGCPFQCSFCCINAPFGKPNYRRWSPQTVGREIEKLHQKYGVRNFKFVDEMFVLNAEHVKGVCSQIVKRNLDLNIWAYARVDTVKDSLLPDLKRAGFNWLALGIESASEHVRDGVAKGSFGKDEVLGIVESIKTHGINIIGNYIFGLPDDTLKTMRDTLHLALEANCEFANFYSAMAYPGSKLYNRALEKEVSLPASWSGYSQHSYDCFPMATDHLTNAQVLAFRDKAFHQYFTAPSYLKSIREKFGEAVVTHIEDMTKLRLKRHILEEVAA